MKLSIVQFEPKFGDKVFNFSKINKYIDTVETDIIVFPELATTGYDFKSKNEVIELADSFTSEKIKEIADKSKKLNKIIVFGFPEIDEGKTYNSAAILFPDENLNKLYRKTHLFFRERFCFEEGNTGFFNIYFKNWDINIGTMICYDWRFPEAARTLGLKGADLIVCPSNLVTDVWDVSTPSRALENKVYLAVANRIGIENRNNNELLFNGKSVVYKYNSEELCKAGRENEEVISCEIYPEKTRDKSFNDYNDIFTDRRPDYYL